jgi:predicted ATPase
LEFLRFLRDSCNQEIPPQVIKGAVGQQIFNASGDESFRWNLVLDDQLHYSGQVTGPIGQIRVMSEQIAEVVHTNGQHLVYLERVNGEERGMLYEPKGDDTETQVFHTGRDTQLSLRVLTNPQFTIPYYLREYIARWRFYSGFNISLAKIRRAVLVEQTPFLDEDAGNLSAVLHYLMTEHRRTFDDLERLIRQIVPDFEYLTVKARGGPGEVIAFWKETGYDRELSLADLSEGILRLLCWMVLCLQPNPPTLICIDEPDQGIHPRTLPILAGLFKKASQRTQLLLTTHNSYFLTQFDLSNIAVMRKKQGKIEFVKPGDSKTIIEMLEDFGSEQLEQMHRTDELEALP